MSSVGAKYGGKFSRLVIEGCVVRTTVDSGSDISGCRIVGRPLLMFTLVVGLSGYFFSINEPTFSRI